MEVLANVAGPVCYLFGLTILIGAPLLWHHNKGGSGGQ